MKKDWNDSSSNLNSQKMKANEYDRRAWSAQSINHKSINHKAEGTGCWTQKQAKWRTVKRSKTLGEWG